MFLLVSNPKLSNLSDYNDLLSIQCESRLVIEHFWQHFVD